MSMSPIFHVQVVGEVELEHFAESFAKMSCRDQAIVLQEMFDELRYQTKTFDKYQTQLSFIANHLKHKNFGVIKDAIENLHGFLNDK